MSAYVWNPRELNQVMAMPAGVADRLLAAGAEQLRVLVWFSRHGQEWDVAACAADLKMEVGECEGCLRFWLEQGLLLDAQALPAAEVAPTKAPVTRTAPVKPVWQEVLAYQKEHREFTAFLQEVSARMGRPLNHGDNATLLYLITTAGLPQASVLMAVGYAVSVGKTSIRYVESLALAWADEDIVTPEQVDARIRQMQQERAAAAKIEELLGLPRALNANQAKTADKWLNSWAFSNAMLTKAYAITMENCDKFGVAYMDKILERWHAEGVDTPDKIPAAIAKKKGPAATNPEQSSLDADGFEEQLLKYRPKFNKA
ncbi:MAG: DnaD domain protein [Clostridia bacterium]|nr:DnaD domain protein [Clostridia bacterium]